MRRGGRKLEIWESRKYGVKVEIRFDPVDGLFFAEYGGEQMSSKVLEELRKQIGVQVEEKISLKWIGILEVKCRSDIQANVRVKYGRGVGNGYSIERADNEDDASEAKGELAIQFERYWITWTGGMWMSSSWQYPEVADPNDRWSRTRTDQMSEWWDGKKMDASLEFPWVKKDDRNEERQTIYLPYDQAMWDTLGTICGKLKELAMRIDDLLGTNEGRAKLTTAFAGLMLPAPEKNNDED